MDWFAAFRQYVQNGVGEKEHASVGITGRPGIDYPSSQVFSSTLNELLSGKPRFRILPLGQVLDCDSRWSMPSTFASCHGCQPCNDKGALCYRDDEQFAAFPAYVYGTF